jgi:HlyD family secretion protein
MKKRWWLIIIAVIVLIAAGYTYQKGQKKTLEVSGVEAGIGDIKVTVSATETGTVKATNEVLVVPRVSGDLVQLGVEEGDFVSAGQVIARLDSTEMDDQVRASESRLESMRASLRETNISAEAQPHIEEAAISQAEAGLRAAEAGLEIAKRGAREEEIAAARAAMDEAKVALDNAKRDLDRQKELLDRGFVSKSVVDSAQAQYDMAEARHKSASENLRMLENQVRPEDVKLAEQRVAQAQAQVASARAGAIQSKTLKESVRGLQAQVNQLGAEVKRMKTQLAYLTIRAPISGQVVRLNCKEGEFVVGGTSYGLQAQQIAMMTIADMRDLWVEATVNEADVAKVRAGQPVEVVSDAFPDKTFHGKLTEISPAALADRQNVRTFKAEVLLSDAKGHLRPGMSADMEVITKTRKRVLTIPAQALIEEKKKNYVYTVDKGVVKKREVKIGEKSWEKVEILSGLTKGQVVVTTIDTKGLKDGIEVEVKKEEPKEPVEGKAAREAAREKSKGSGN